MKETAGKQVFFHVRFLNHAEQEEQHYTTDQIEDVLSILEASLAHLKKLPPGCRIEITAAAPEKGHGNQ